MHTWRRALAAASIAISTWAGVAAAAAQPPLPPVPYGGHFAPFPTGLRALAYQFKGLGVSSFTASYVGGSADDPPGKEGLAALAVRLVERGAGGARTYQQRMFQQTPRFGASVERDSLELWAAALPSRVAGLLAVEADRLRDPLAGITEAQFAAAKAEQLGAAQRALEEPDAEWALEHALAGTPPGRPALGTPASLAAITFADVRAFCADHFRPERLVLAVTGPGAPPAFAAEVARAFGDLATGARRDPAGPPKPLRKPPDGSPELAVRRGLAEGPQLWLTWALPGFAGQDDVGVEVAAEVVRRWLPGAVGSTGRLKEILVRHEVAANVLAVRLDLARKEDAGPLVARLRARDPKLRARPAEVRRVRRASFWWMEDPRPGEIVQMLRVTGEADALGTWRRRRVDRLLEDLGPYLERWLTPARMGALLVEPLPGASIPERPAEVPIDGPPVGLLRLPPGGTYDARSVAPAPGLDTAHRFRLASGLEVVVYRRPGFPKVSAALAVRAGPSPRGLAELALAAAAPDANFIGAGSGCTAPSPRHLPQGVVFHSQGLSNELALVLDELACVSEKQATRASDLSTHRKQWADALESIPTATAAAVESVERLFPGSAEQVVLRKKTLAAITASDADAWLATEFRPDHATLVLGGDLPADSELVPLVRRRFEAWQAGDAPRGPLPAARSSRFPERRAILLVPAKDATRALTFVWTRMPPPVASSDVVAAGAVELDLQLRLEREAGSGVATPLVSPRGSAAGGALQLSYWSAPDAAGRALSAVLEGLADEAAAPVMPEHAEFLRWSIAGHQPFRFSTVQDVVDRLVEAALDGADPDVYERQAAAVASLDPERIERAARSLGTGREVIAVVGDEARVRPSLEKAGYQVEVLPSPGPR
ncbi:M16 family metallopeptidase [Anaeromyxobacter paludicola]|uniref:Peptidase M16 C-terminal domain-containing protein n=1 Tax=Anaeromyxobacter paludicola TaxID=2918171 RepID=A0ABN6NAS4_9BACT|nr:insulinase family protein [Anaeromyxobacter paludicola]BDG09526.1 hypothetical protein AMPC_26390 [Anaeromyxobacter paludicola]